MLYFHTLRYLKLAQIWGRLVFHLRSPTPDLRPAPMVRVILGRWTTPAARQPSMVSEFRFRFLNEEHEIVFAADWNSSHLAKLWLYNLHYFDDLNALHAKNRLSWHRSLLARWIGENPPGCGTGWEPYPLSLRIVNWVKWDLAGNRLDDVARHSLAIQARYLSHRLERHLLGNHLFSNAKALIFAGAYFDSEEAGRWLSLGMKILAREVPEQILTDGGHFERSTMYHALAYEDLLDLSNLAVAFPQAFAPWKSEVADWRQRLASMGHWLVSMCHPDGEISFFNDAAIGIAPSPSHLVAYAERLGLKRLVADEGITWLEASGYVRMQSSNAVLIIDVAPVGPDYLPGHAHADTLSFELSLGRERVIVNSGTSRYGMGSQRERERSTAAHSTVEIDGQDSSEVWGGFRVARRAYPFDVRFGEDENTLEVSAAHDGYIRLAGRPVHRRQWRLTANALEVQDHVEGAYKAAIARYYFHPAVVVHIRNNGGEVVGADITGRWKAEAVDVSMTQSDYSPRFGVLIKNTCLEVQLARGCAKVCLDWNSRETGR